MSRPAAPEANSGVRNTEAAEGAGRRVTRREGLLALLATAAWLGFSLGLRPLALRELAYDKPSCASIDRFTLHASTLVIASPA